MEDLVNLRGRWAVGPALAPAPPGGGGHCLPVSHLSGRRASWGSQPVGNGTGSGGTIGKGGGQRRQRAAGKKPSLAPRPVRWHLGECVTAFTQGGGGRSGMRSRGSLAAGTPAAGRGSRKPTPGHARPRAAGRGGRAGTGARPAPGRPGWYPGSLASPHPPLGAVGGRRAPEALPSLLPPRLPHPGEGRYNLWLQLYTSEKKKKFAECPTPKKKIRNRVKKTCEWAWRMGLFQPRRSRGSPSRSASLRESSRARRPGPQPHGPPSR